MTFGSDGHHDLAAPYRFSGIPAAKTPSMPDEKVTSPGGSEFPVVRLSFSLSEKWWPMKLPHMPALVQRFQNILDAIRFSPGELRLMPAEAAVAEVALQLSAINVLQVTGASGSLAINASRIVSEIRYAI